MICSVLDYLDKAYAKYPNKTAVVDKNTEYSYLELMEAVKSTASFICKQINTERKPIIVFMENSFEAIASFWGIAYSNNIYVPLDAKLPKERVGRIGDIVHAVGAIWCAKNETYTEIRAEYEQILGCKVYSYSDIKDFSVCETDIIDIKEKIIDTNPLYVVFTSGSTGEPKGVTISHRAVIDFTEEASEAMGFDKNDKFLNQAPFYFDASVPDLFCTVRNCSELHIVPRAFFSFPTKLADYISEKKITQLYWVPSALVTMANLKALNSIKMSSLKRVMFCGEVMPTKQLNMWKNFLPDVVYVNYYGPSETTYASSYYIVDRDFEETEFLPIGKAARNTELLVLSEKNQVINEPNEIGELCIRGSGLSLGYYNNPQKTREVFVQNPTENSFVDLIYKTGDLVHYDDNGYIYYDGRKDQQIKHMGYRIELGEIECNAVAMEGIAKAACIYVADKRIIGCFYEGSASEDEIREYLKEKLPFYMIPEHIEKLRALPMNANGKTDRLDLKRRLESE